jgi:hypothetical protein
MTLQSCSSSCRRAHAEPGALERELGRRKWVGRVLIAVSCALAYAAYDLTAVLWLPCALAAWYGTYQMIYSKGCAVCGAPREGMRESPKLNAAQHATRRRMAHGFLVATAALALMAAGLLPLFWPLAAIAGWFAASFYVAAWTGYVGCPEVGAIPSWILRREIATRCTPLERIDARAE